MRLWTIAVPVLLLFSPGPLGADDAKRSERIDAIAAQLKEPAAGMRAAYKLVDAGAPAVSQLIATLGSSRLADERVEICLREIARTHEGARAEIDWLGQAITPAARARLVRALSEAGVAEAIYPIVDALDSPQEPLEVIAFGPQGAGARDAGTVKRPVSTALVAFGERAVAALRKRLAKTSSPTFRIEAAWVLGSLKAKAALPDLVAIASDERRSSDERVAALEALTAIGDPAGREAIAVALASEDASIRRAGARGLAALPDPSALPQLAKLLEEEKDDDQRLEYVRALGALEDPIAAQPLQVALARASDAGPSMRVPLAIACVQALAATGDRSSTATLVQVLEKGLGFQVEHATSVVLARIPDLGTAPREKLRAMVEDVKSSAVPRACAAWILAQRGEDDPLKALFEAARHKEWAVRAGVATLLGEGKLDGAVPVLLTLAADSHPSVRRAAAFALGKSEDSTAGAALVKAGRQLDADPVVRRLYAAAFSDAIVQGTLDREQIKPARALLSEALEHVFPDGTLEERRAEALSLGRLGDRSALLRIASAAVATNEIAVESRRATIEVLGRMGKHDGTEQMLDGLVRDPGVGDDACLALARIRGESFFEPKWRAILAPSIPYH